MIFSIISKIRSNMEIEKQIFINVLKNEYNAPEDLIQRVEKNWNDAEFEHRDEQDRRPIPGKHKRCAHRGYIISKQTLNDGKHVFKYINPTTVIGFNYDDLFNTHALEENEETDDNLISAILSSATNKMHKLRKILINEADELLDDAVEVLNEYINKADELFNDKKYTDCQKYDLLATLARNFESDERINLQLMYATVRFTFSTYDEAKTVIEQAKIFSNTLEEGLKWIEDDFSYNGFYEYFESYTVKLRRLLPKFKDFEIKRQFNEYNQIVHVADDKYEHKLEVAHEVIENALGVDYYRQIPFAVRLKLDEKMLLSNKRAKYWEKIFKAFKEVDKAKRASKEKTNNDK